MAEPTCRTCYADTLSAEARIRFLAEQINMPVHYCPEHQQRAAEIERMFSKMVGEGKVIWLGSMTGRMPRPPEPQFPRYDERREFPRTTKDYEDGDPWRP